MPDPVYLDSNATAPLRPEAAAAMAEALALTGNPSSVHGYGRAARQRLEAARRAVAALVAADPTQIIFTSGGTEANNLALSATGRQRILVSAGEHDSVLQAVPHAQRIPLDAHGRLDLTALERALAESDEPALVSVMQANNETGVLQPMTEVAGLARLHGALLHCDAIQAAGKVPVDLAAIGADMISLSAHKLGGPPGIGALALATGREVTGQLRGGGQERSRRAGTENLPGAAGFGAAAAVAAQNLDKMAALAGLRDSMEQALLAIAPELRIFGQAAPRLPNTSCFGVAGLEAETQVMALDLAGVAVSAGSACSSGKVRPSHVLMAMGATAAEASAAIRVSLGWQSTAGDIERLLEAWRALYLRCRPRLAPSRSSAA